MDDPSGADAWVATELVRLFVEAWNSRDFVRFDEIMGPEAVLHVSGKDLPCDPAHTRDIARTWTAAFPDWRFDLRTVIANGEFVAAHLPYWGLLPAARQQTADASQRLRRRDGHLPDRQPAHRRGVEGL